MLHTLGWGYVLLMTLCRAGSGVAHSGGGGYVLLMTLCRAGSGVAHSGRLCTLDDPMQSWIRCCTLWGVGLCTLDDPMQIWIRRCTLWGGVMYS